MKTVHGPLLKPLVLAIQLSLAAGCSIYAINSYAENQYLQSYNIGAGSLSDALTQFSLQSGITLTIEHSKIEGLKTAGLSGQYSIENGFNTLLENTPYTIQKNKDHYILVNKPQVQQPPVRDMGQLKPIDVNASGGNKQNVGGTVGVNQLPVITVSAERNGSAEDGYLVKKLKKVGPWGEKTLQDTPYSMSVMSQELIENSISGDMDQIYKMNPIIQNAATSTTYGTPYATIRGFSSQYGIIDGVRLSSTSSGISMEELERVELINGLTGFMYGVGNVGGTTNYILKRPTYDSLKNITIGNYGHQQWFGHIDLGNQIDSEGQLAYRFNASYQNGETAKDNQNVERRLVSGALDWNVTDNWLVQLEAANQYYRADGREQSFYSDIADVWPKALDNSKTYVPNWVYNETETNRIGLNSTWHINDIFTLRNAYLYKQDTREHTQAFPTITDSGWKLQWMSKINPVDYISHGIYSYLDSQFYTKDIKHKLTFGFSGDIYQVKQYEKASYWASETPTNLTLDQLANYNLPSEFLDKNYGKKYKANDSINTNIIIGDEITFNKNWQALLGFNYTTIKSEAFNTSGNRTSHYDKSKFTPTLSLIYKPIENITTYATYIEGLEKGTIVGSTYKNAGEVLEPLVSKQYEIGAKYNIFDNLLLSSALFRIEKPYEFSDNALPTPTYVQDGLRIHQGIELTLTGKVSDELTIMAGGTLLNAKIDETNTESLQGKKVPDAASKLAKIYMEYKIPKMDNLILTGGAYYTGSRYKDNANLQKVDSYTILDIGARYLTKLGEYPSTFNLNIINITNKDYWASTDTLGIPRTVAFSVKTQF